MGVELGKGDGGKPRERVEPLPQVRTDGALARTTPPPAPYEKREPSVPAQAEPARGVSPQALGLLTAAWTAGWIIAFANGVWWLGLVMLMVNGPLFGYVRHRGVPWAGGERRARRLERHRARALRHQGTPLQGPPAPQALPDPVSQAERALAGAVVRSETSGGRIDAESVELVREVDHLLRPMLAQLRTREADPQVRHDLETLAGEHLPRTVDDYLVLPDDYAHEHRTSAGTTPADELRSQLQLLVEGCRQLREAVLARDVDRQQQQSRFLESKFRKSDLDL
ncbi:hypothetical protein [Kineococcus rhizosphaerae]|uniref:Uncharacterized protein n=1 Tax=Kineococcus rhizosphaerae TaxID=559628 RepID=A0A2T0R8A9_9ACTN|nr:hypothetical protein [Kineococcus rhizosphaerae]PRY17398.1 hypothetical protein CLV37_102361 [Kineococcus rhizosphaerae]